MDNLDATNTSLTNSYFLSSTTDSYNGMLDGELDLSEILQEFQTLLSISNDSEASCKKKQRPSTIIAGSHLNDDHCGTQDISHVRSEQNNSSIVRNLNFSGMSFRVEKLEHYSTPKRISFRKNSSYLLNSADDWKTSIETITNNYEKIENESFPTWINVSLDEDKSNFEYKHNSRIIPDIMISAVSENSFVADNNDSNGISKANSMNLLSVDDTRNFFTRRKKERYFLSPKKLIEKYEREEDTKMENLSSNDDNHSPNTRADVKKFCMRVRKLPSFCLEDITVEWPSVVENNREDFSFSTSTPKEDAGSSSQFFANLSPVNRREIENNAEPPFDFGVSGKRYFARKKGLKYFSSLIQ